MTKQIQKVDSMLVTIEEFSPVKLKKPIIIEGFPGIGMIGTISTSYLADKLEMKLVGQISSTHFPPIASIHDFKPMSPARIYASEKYNTIILFSEFVIPSEIVYSLSAEILNYAKKKNASAIYSFAGMGAEKPDDKIYSIASTAQIGQNLKKAGSELIKEGATQGVSGVLLVQSALENFPAANLLIQTSSPLDPKGSAKLLQFYSKLTGLPIDTTELVYQGAKIENKLKDSLEKMQSMHQNYKEMAENPMYS